MKQFFSSLETGIVWNWTANPMWWRCLNYFVAKISGGKSFISGGEWCLSGGENDITSILYAGGCCHRKSFLTHFVRKLSDIFANATHLMIIRCRCRQSGRCLLEIGGRLFQCIGLSVRLYVSHSSGSRSTLSFISKRACILYGVDNVF